MLYAIIEVSAFYENFTSFNEDERKEYIKKYIEEVKNKEKKDTKKEEIRKMVLVM